MKPPIFLAYEGDVIAFDSAEAAEGYAEPLDVKYNEFVAYDADGRLLSATCIGNRVKLSLAESESKHAAALATTLRCYLEAIGRPADAGAEHELPTLVAAFGEFVLDVRGQSMSCRPSK